MKHYNQYIFISGIHKCLHSHGINSCRNDINTFIKLAVIDDQGWSKPDDITMCRLSQ